MQELLLLQILLPLAFGVAALFVAKKWRGPFALVATAVNLAIAALLFKSNITYTAPWAGFGFEFILRTYQFSGFIMAAAACFGILVTLYSTVFMKDKEASNQFYAYLLISLAMVNGAVLADNLVAMLFCWEGLLLTLFGMIAIGRKGAFKSATKAFVIVGISDLCMMGGIALAGYLAGTLQISKISLDIAGLGGLAFILLMIGAISKAGSMPFHSWIPDAALDAPLPFMAILPASLEKLLGIYFLARISLDMFKLDPHSWVSMVMMIVGAITILLAVMMALIQKDYKRLLSYHAISQVGYMILGIGTLVPVGIVGGLFHMINHAMYKSCLFLTGGSVEKQAGTTDLAKLGGLWKKMPVTLTCFLVAAASISGVPPFNGFFSKELVYDGALERGWIFYAAAILGSFLTAASFLKLGHSAYFGKISKENEGVKEAPVQMLVPMIVIAGLCVLFGLWNSLPLSNLIQPILGSRLEGHNYGGFHFNPFLVGMTIFVLIAAFVNHFIGTKISGSGLGAADHIHHAPGLSDLYDKAEKRLFDPYDIVLKIVGWVSKIAWSVDRGIDWVYNVFSVNAAFAVSNSIRFFHNGSYARYIVWSLAGAGMLIYLLMK